MSVTRYQNFDSSVLVDIYLDGFATGSATTCLGFGDEAFADRLSDNLLSRLKADPIAMEAIRKEILERIRGINSGPFTMTVFGNGKP